MPPHARGMPGSTTNGEDAVTVYLIDCTWLNYNVAYPLDNQPLTFL
jgi:hypothetical protein